MAEAISSEENKEIKFDRHDLTPLEHIMMGSSVDVVINGNKICVNSRELEKLREDKEALRIILTPISLTENKRTLGEVRQARMHGEIFSGFLTPFEIKGQLKYIDKKIYLTFNSGELDERGQLETFGVYFSQNKQKIDLPKNASEEIVIEKGFKELIKYTGNRDGVMQYKINTGKGN